VKINEEIKQCCEDKNLVKKSKILTRLFTGLAIILTPILWPFGPLIITAFLLYNLNTFVLLIKLIIN
jgi:hypothetical protein